ncbi:MAG: MarR family winged helix-turn-helix transcriptional regulator [Eubacteriales bacterium]
MPVEHRHEVTPSLFLAFKKVLKCFYEIAQAHGMAPAQLGAMRKLWKNDGMTNTELGEQLFLKTSTVTALIDRMERDGFVFRERNKDDRRVVNIWLTEKGKELKDSVPDIESIIVEKLKAELSVAELKELIRLLNKVAEALP